MPLLLTASPQPTLSILELVAAADPIVKGVMLLLVLSSVACWAIVIEKSIRTWRLKSDVKSLEKLASGDLDVAQADGLVERVLSAAEAESNDGSSRGEARSEIRARLERAMKQRFKAELESIESGLPFLATIGSAAPFIGLFGTVWGIMNSFTAIAARQDTSLATVAPGIAEALFATALGLVAAIPAVMAYNHYAVKLGRAGQRGNAAIVDIAKAISRPHADTGARVEPLRAGKAY
jgi:biopolymer transport protein ExbB/TolQ